MPVTLVRGRRKLIRKPLTLSYLCNPDTVPISACDGDEVSLGRWIKLCTLFPTTPRGDGIIASKPNTVITATGDDNEGGIRRSFVALVHNVSTPRDHYTILSEANAVRVSASDGEKVFIIRRFVLGLVPGHVAPPDQKAPANPILTGFRQNRS